MLGEGVRRNGAAEGGTPVGGKGVRVISAILGHSQRVLISNVLK